jgi:hypothetical protein
MYKLSSLITPTISGSFFIEDFSQNSFRKSTNSKWDFSSSFAISSFDYIYVDGASPSKINLCRALLSQQRMHLHASKAKTIMTIIFFHSHPAKKKKKKKKPKLCC